MKEKCTTILAIIAILGAFFSSYLYLENRYALAEEVRGIEKTFQYKFKSMEIRETDRRISVWDDKCNHRPPDKQACEEAIRLRADRNQQELELKELGKKK